MSTAEAARADGAYALRVEGLSVAADTPNGRTLLVDDASFTIRPGEVMGLVGESGSGKSTVSLTIMRLLAASLSITAGRVLLADDTDLTSLPERGLRRLLGNEIAMIFQEPMTSLNPVYTVGDQLTEPLRLHRRMPRRRALSRAQELLEMVGIAHAGAVLSQYPHQLSGGMRQRVMIAMAMSCEPKVLICDEPTTALDVTTQAEILALIKRVQASTGTACIFITHDMGVAADIADRIAVMYRGRIVENEPTEQILGAPAHPYTRALLACVPQLGSDNRSGFPAIDGALLQEAVETGDGGMSVTRMPSFPARVGIAADAPAIVIEDVVKEFRVKRSPTAPKSVFTAVNGVSLEIAAGEFFGLVGESGSGKTTLGRMVAALETPTSGRITIGDHGVGEHGLIGDNRAFRRNVQIVFQDPQSSLDPRKTVLRSIAEPLEVLRGLRGEELRRTAQDLIDEVELPAGTGAKHPAQLSGGQRQRVAIARALAANPRFIVADEPTSALDVSVQGAVMNVLLELQRSRGLGFLFVTHNLSLVLSVADRIGVMQRGEIIELGRPDDILRNPQHAYTRRLLAANPGFGDPSQASAA